MGTIKKLVSSKAAICIFTVQDGHSKEPTEFDAIPAGDVWLLENGDTRKILKVKGLLEISVTGGRLRNSEDVDWRAAEPKVAILTKTYATLWSPLYRQGCRIEFLEPPPNFYPLRLSLI